MGRRTVFNVCQFNFPLRPLKQFVAAMTTSTWSFDSDNNNIGHADQLEHTWHVRMCVWRDAGVEMDVGDRVIDQSKAHLAAKATPLEQGKRKSSSDRRHWVTMGWVGFISLPSLVVVVVAGGEQEEKGREVEEEQEQARQAVRVCVSNQLARSALLLLLLLSATVVKLLEQKL